MKTSPMIKHWTMIVLVVMLLAGSLGLSACGAGTLNVDASQADIDKSVSMAGWKITLKGLPKEETVLGGGGVSHQAEVGKYVIVPVEVVNSGTDITLFPADLIYLVDSEGNEYPTENSTPEFTYRQTNKEIDILMDSPVPGGQTRNSVVIFDVPESTTAYTLAFRGSSEIFRLGFPSK